MFFAACSQSIPNASQTLRSYQVALKTNNAKAAYALLSPATQQEMSYSRFEQDWKQSRSEREHQKQALNHIISSGQEMAYVTINHRFLIQLTRDDQGWRIHSPTTNTMGATTPKAAIARLSNTLNESSAIQLLSLLSEAKRKPLEAEFSNFVSGLNHSLQNEYSEFKLNDARVNYRFATPKRRYKIILIQDKTLGWLIDDISILPTLRPEENEKAQR